MAAVYGKSGVGASEINSLAAMRLTVATALPPAIPAPEPPVTPGIVDSVL